MALYLQQKTVQAWEWLFAIQRAKSCSLSRKKTTLPFTAIKVEALAARRALNLALKTRFQQITLEGDSQTLISALVNNTHSLSSFGHIMKDIQFLASCFSKINYSHVHRHCNTVAHSQQEGQFLYLKCKSGWRMYHQIFFLYFRPT